MASMVWIAGAAVAAPPYLTRRPVVIGKRADPICRQGEALAVAAFRSDDPDLQSPLSRPLAVASDVVIVADPDGSEQPSLPVSGFFKTLKRTVAPDYVETVHWQAIPRDHKRLAIVQSSTGWRGDAYTIHLIDDDVSVDRLLAAGRNGSVDTYKPLLSDLGWRMSPPLVLVDHLSGDAWVIDQGTWDLFADWTIYTVRHGVVATPCSIRFRAAGSRDIMDMTDAKRRVAIYGGLSPPVRRLAAALDNALGPGRGDGTLQQTARVRHDVERDWLNLQSRPWALTGRPYNSRPVVDRGLASWAQGMPERARVRREIIANIRPSTDALAALYRRRFRLTAPEARKMAAFAIDYVMRDNFVFHEEQTPGEPQPAIRTPWPASVR